MTAFDCAEETLSVSINALIKVHHVTVSGRLSNPLCGWHSSISVFKMMSGLVSFSCMAM